MASMATRRLNWTRSCLLYKAPLSSWYVLGWSPSSPHSTWQHQNCHSCATYPSSLPFTRHFTTAEANVETPYSARGERSDPTAKRPTVKCDPYGLSGQSLSFEECNNLLSTLDAGWRLIDTTNSTGSPQNNGENKGDAESASEIAKPIFLQKLYHHQTFHNASKFLSHISLIAENTNHYPFLSMERVLVDDLTKFSKAFPGNSDDSDGFKRKRKVKGWIFVSTVRCSTYRPPTKTAEEECSAVMRDDKGLTYHDFHLAMGIDIEAGREVLKQLLLQIEE
jgi:pterin-4a-carbinolamine dehydratase